MMIVRGVNVFPSQIEEIILSDTRLAPHFVIELRRNRTASTKSPLVVEARSDPDDESSPQCDRDLALSHQGVRSE